MKRSSILGVVLALAVLGAPALAGAAEVAKLLTFSGTLRTTSGTPETVFKNITFRLYAAPEGGTALFTETLGVQPQTDGTFSVKIGSTATLDGALFAQQLYLGIQVSGEAEMVPRTQLTPTPYTWSVDWASLRGFPAACPPGQFVTGLGPTLTCSTPPQAVASVVGSGVIQASTAGGTVTVSLASTGCTSGQVLGYDGMTWGCETLPSPVTSVTALAPLTGGGGGTPSIGLMTCSNGQILKMGASTWACGADVDTGLTSVSVASPITGNGAGTPVGLMSCATAGHVLKWSGSAWTCQPDADTDTGLTSVSRDASLVGDGTPGSPLGAAFEVAEPSGANGVATTAARSDHSHSIIEKLTASEAFFEGTVTPTAAVFFAGHQVIAINIQPGVSATWNFQLGFKPALAPTSVVVSLTSQGWLDSTYHLPEFVVEAFLVKAGATLGDVCALGPPTITYNPATITPMNESVVVKAGFTIPAGCVPADDSTLIVRVGSPGSYPSNVFIFNAFAQIFF